MLFFTRICILTSYIQHLYRKIKLFYLTFVCTSLQRLFVFSHSAQNWSNSQRLNTSRRIKMAESNYVCVTALSLFIKFCFCFYNFFLTIKPISANSSQDSISLQDIFYNTNILSFYIYGLSVNHSSRNIFHASSWLEMFNQKYNLWTICNKIINEFVKSDALNILNSFENMRKWILL